MPIDVGFISDQNKILTEKLIKVARSLQNARDENNALRAITRTDTRNTLLEDTLLACFANNIKAFKPKDYIHKTKDKPTLEWGNIVGVSDWHVGEEVSSIEVNQSNEYNYKITDRRVSKYIKKIYNAPVPKSFNLIIADLGDNIRGIIHGGITDTEGGLMESIVKAVDIQSRFIQSMLEKYELIDYRFVVGNHSRLDDAITSKGKFKDYSWLILQMLIRLFKDEPRITFNIAESGYHLISVNGANIMLFHGDTLRSYNPTVEGSRLKAQDICNGLFGKVARHFISGHKHIATTVANQYEGMNIISGTLVGANEYGVQNGFSAISASQFMVHVDSNGCIENVLHFNLK